MDLSLATTHLASRVIRYEIESDMNHESDHLPIATCIDKRATYRQRQMGRNWKGMDRKTLRLELGRRLPPRRRPRTKTAPGSYVAEIVSALVQAIDISVPARIPRSKAKTGWDEERSWILAETKQLRRAYGSTHTEKAWEAYRSARGRKGKIIGKALSKMHRQTIERVAECPSNSGVLPNGPSVGKTRHQD